MFFWKARIADPQDSLRTENEALKIDLVGLLSERNASLSAEFREKQALREENRALRLELEQKSTACSILQAELLDVRFFAQRLHEESASQHATMRKTIEKLESSLRQIGEAEAFLKSMSLIECPISLSPMEYPTNTKCGHVFDWDSIHRWMDGHNSCPVCRASLRNEDDDSQHAMHVVLNALRGMKATTSPLEKVKLYDQIKEEFQCPIYLELMNDPIVIGCGRLMDRGAFEIWIHPQCTRDTGNCTSLPSYLRQVHELLRIAD